MKSRKGFTLIELMVVIIIVGVLAAIVVPLLLSRIEKAKYSEGKAIASQIATAVRAYAAEATGTPLAAPDIEDDLGFKTAELDGKYFVQTGTTVTGVSLDTVTGTLDYKVQVKTRVALKPGDVILQCTDNVTTFYKADGTTEL
jgi:type IV pilus assembly protein PilA